MSIANLPPAVHVIVRDWLSANHILLKSRDGHVLIDTGYGRDASVTLDLLAAPTALGKEPLARIVNTHGHSDHIGGNARIAARYGCPIVVPIGEAPLIERWDTHALWLDYADQRCERFAYAETIAPGDTQVWADLQWQAIAAPGHDMGAVVFYNPEHRILISGDALWEQGFGLVMPPEIDPACMPATRATLDAIAALDVRAVIPGHGGTFTEVSAALDRAYKRLAAMESDSHRTARSAVKSMLAFSLLAHRKLELATLPEYVEQVGFFRDFNALFFRLKPEQFAAMLIDDLERVGAVRRESGWLLPV